MSEPQEVAARRMGQGFPVLVIHGWTMSGAVEAHDFEPIFAKRDGYSRIYVDLPGMGSTPIGKVKDLDAMLECVSNFVEKHILPAKFLLIGSSCGAYIARALAFKYASAIDGLLLRVPVVEPESSKRDVNPFLPAISDEKLLWSLSNTDREKLGDIPVQTPEYINTLKRRLEVTVDQALAASDSAALDFIRNDPTRYRLGAPNHSPEDPFTKPALIVTGRQDTDVGYRDAWSLVASYSRATFVTLDRANHDLPVDETDMHLFQSLVIDWLRRVEESHAADSQP